MIVTVCASLRFKEEITEVAKALQNTGHQVYLPIGLENPDYREVREFDYWKGMDKEHAALKKRYNLIRAHFEKIEKSDAILVLNYDVDEIKNYIGGNAFLEMGVAYYLRKPIYLLNPIPEMAYTSEIEAMEPIALNGDLTKIGEGNVG